MPRHNFSFPKGTIEYIDVESSAISNNVLGDPNKRKVAVYLPEGYASSEEEYPLLVDIVGFTGSGLAHVGWKAFAESVPQRIERLISEGKMGKVIVAFPDCFTSLGGNQYINSSALGNWADFLKDEMVQKLESNYRIKSGRNYRGIFGKSSGGYGAIVHGMIHAESWGAIACHSGDMAFELAYLRDFPKVATHLARFNGSVNEFMQHLEGNQKMAGSDFETLMTLAMAATYDPAPEKPYGVRLPIDLDTCELNETLWQRWLDWDPVQLIENPGVQENLRSLKGLFIDCGSFDQYALLFGARKLSQRLTDLEIEHVFEEFPDNHSGVDYRMDISLPFLYEKLTGE